MTHELLYMLYEWKPVRQLLKGKHTLYNATVTTPGLSHISWTNFGTFGSWYRGMEDSGEN